VHRLLPVLLPTIFGNSFAIKTHAGPTGTALSLMQRGQTLPPISTGIHGGLLCV
jgi:hypothetical protein